MKSLNLVVLSVMVSGSAFAQSTLVPTYESIRDQIFTAKCLTCHAAGGRADDVPLGDYAALMADGTIVVANDLSKSSIIAAITAPTNGIPSMPPKKSGIVPVTSQELAVIQTWIQNGAPEK